MRLTTVVFVVMALVAGCRAQRSAPSQTATTSTTSTSPPTGRPGEIVVTAFGARGDGVTDDRVAIQAAIDQAAKQGGTVYLPRGTYRVGRTGGEFYCLLVPGHVALRGDGRDATVLQQAPMIGESVRLLYITGDQNRLSDLALDGNKRAQKWHEHRHGIFVTKSRGLVVERVTSRNFTGDGFYLYHGANDTRFVDVLATGNDRSGLALCAQVDGTQVVDSKFIGNGAQQIDSEPGTPHLVSNTTITGSVLDGGGVSDDFVLTCSGTSSQTPGRGWNVRGNTINGGIFVVWTNDVVIADNTGVNPTSKPWVTVNRSSSNVQITGNRIRMARGRASAKSAVLVQGTQGSAPANILVADNQVELEYEGAFGIRAEGAISVDIERNDLRGAGRRAPGFAGIQVRATVPERDFEKVVIAENKIRNFGERGLQVVGNGAARLLSLDIRRNRFEDDTATPSMTTAISLDDGTGAARNIAVVDNEVGCGVTSDVVNVPLGAKMLTREPRPAAQGQAASGQAASGGAGPANVYVKRSKAAAPPPCSK